MAGTSLAVQWLRLHTSTAGGTVSIPGQGTKIPHAALCGQKKKKVFQCELSSLPRVVVLRVWTALVPETLAAVLQG